MILLILFAAMFFVMASPYLINLINGVRGGDFRGGSGVNSTEQIEYILKHPFV